MKQMSSTVIFIVGFMLCSTEQWCRAAQQGGTSEFPVIRTSFGPVRGQVFISPWTNKIINSFKGIPYAAPPIGDLRFQDPIPPKKWLQVRDATMEKAICPQPMTNLTQSEDCLYLNVYSPQLPLGGHRLLPVMVFLHGGVFTTGSGNYDFQGPDFLVAEGVVYVSINYRLGALGFLNLGIPGAPGNAGLKDQRLAFLWVQSEIHHFGGDPQQVTLFGQSAGAMSCHFHNISPLSVGLFQRAIGDSGTAISYHDGVRTDGAIYGLMLAEYLNCSTRDKRSQEPRSNRLHPLPGTEVPYINPEVVTNALSCLKTVDFKDIVRAQGQVTDFESDITGLNIFGPTVDKYSSKAPFLPDFPYKLLEQKKEFYVPFLMGVNSDEGIIKLVVDSEEKVRNITNNLEYLYGLEVPQSCFGNSKARELKNFYFKNTLPSGLNVKGYVDVYTDVFYQYGTTVTCRIYESKTNVYLYYFSFNGKFKTLQDAATEAKYGYTGVAHAEELNYLFTVKGVNQMAPYNSIEMITLRRMVKMWTNFVKYGSPTIGPDPLLQEVEWFPASGGRTNHFNIDVNLRMVQEDLLPHRNALWDSITFHHCS